MTKFQVGDIVEINSKKITMASNPDGSIFGDKALEQVIKYCQNLDTFQFMIEKIDEVKVFSAIKVKTYQLSVPDDMEDLQLTEDFLIKVQDETDKFYSYRNYNYNYLGKYKRQDGVVEDLWKVSENKLDLDRICIVTAPTKRLGGFEFEPYSSDCLVSYNSNMSNFKEGLKLAILHKVYKPSNEKMDKLKKLGWL